MACERPDDEETWLRRFGLVPRAEDLPELRAALARRARDEHAEQGEGDTLLMRLICVQLFGAGQVEDSLRVWDAKTASFDAWCSIDVQLLCGAGLEETKRFLGAHPDPDAAKALARLAECEAAGDFDAFSPAARQAEDAAYYGAR